jgi:hypothetical protein
MLLQSSGFTATAITVTLALLTRTNTLSSAGIPAVLSRSSLATADALRRLVQEQQQEHQQQDPKQQRRQLQQQQAFHQAVLDLAVAQLTAFLSLVQIWPQSSKSSTQRSFLSSSHELGSAAQGIMQLTLAVLDSPKSQIKHVKIAMSSVHQLCTSMALEAVRALHLTFAAEDSMATSGALTEQSAMSPAVLQLLHSEQLMRLVAGTQALHAQLLQFAAASATTTSSSSSSSSSSMHRSPRLGSSTAVHESAQAAAVPSSTSTSSSAASELLRTAGFSCTSALRQVATVSDIREYMPCTAMLARCCLWKLCAETARNGSSSSSGQSAPGSCTAHQQQQQQQLAVLQPLLQPWALVQVQLMQLSGMQPAGMG